MAQIYICRAFRMARQARELVEDYDCRILLHQQKVNMSKLNSFCRLPPLILPFPSQ